MWTHRYSYWGNASYNIARSVYSKTQYLLYSGKCGTLTSRADIHKIVTPHLYAVVTGTFQDGKRGSNPHSCSCSSTILPLFSCTTCCLYVGVCVWCVWCECVCVCVCLLYVNVNVCGCVDVWMCGYVDVWMCGCVCCVITEPTDSATPAVSHLFGEFRSFLYHGRASPSPTPAHSTPAAVPAAHPPPPPHSHPSGTDLLRRERTAGVVISAGHYAGAHVSVPTMVGETYPQRGAVEASMRSFRPLQMLHAMIKRVAATSGLCDDTGRAAVRRELAAVVKGLVTVGGGSRPDDVGMQMVAIAMKYLGAEALAVVTVRPHAVVVAVAACTGCKCDGGVCPCAGESESLYFWCFFVFRI